MTMETRRKWNAIFKRFDSSSLTAVQFCRLHDLNTQTFYNMRSRFKHSAGLSQFHRTSCPFPDPAGTELRFVQVRLGA
ncbi:hypothetical protein BO223_09470, partial [Faecalibaculum rodentium]